MRNDERLLNQDIPLDPDEDEPVDPLSVPEIRHHLAHDLRDEDLGLRSLLENPEAFSRSLWAWHRALR